MPDPISISIKAPYEEAIVAGFTFLTELIKGQTPEQKAEGWKIWIDFWKLFGIGK